MINRPVRSPTLPLHEAIGRSEPLGRLLQQLQAARECYAIVQPHLPPGLREAVHAGPLDEQGWSLLVGSGAAASKLRQLLPTLETALRDAGRPVPALRVRVHAPSTGAGRA